MGDVHLRPGVREIQVPGCRFEEAKRLQRRKCARQAEMIATLTAGVKNHRWQSSRQRQTIAESMLMTNNRACAMKFAVPCKSEEAAAAIMAGVRHQE
jgi:hypothetical protein